MKKIFTVILVLAVVAFAANVLFGTEPVEAFEIGSNGFFELEAMTGVLAFDKFSKGEKAYGLQSMGAVGLSFGTEGFSKGSAPGPSNTATGLDFEHVQGAEAFRNFPGGSGKVYNHTKIDGYSHTNVDP